MIELILTIVGLWFLFYIMVAAGAGLIYADFFILGLLTLATLPFIFIFGVIKFLELVKMVWVAA